ncbi:Na+/H+ antiporter subunit A [Caldalkalibacillus salinus]|uniref:Na+/H+ antiporter subunit A n=1 Tax=Caldalkalibacillus salinus TaxID=2803787 RepID=UPI001924FD85|nr:Na+/H+ antiporter subunit A [Caldalkalibacillus salinus]
MSILHLVVLAPFIFAIFVPFLHKYLRHIHTGWFVFIVPVLLFSYLVQFIQPVMNGQHIHKVLPWMPSIGVSFNVYVDGLGLLFSLLITGIGALVVLYSIYYLSKEKEALNSFYVYLLMFMGAMLGVVLSDNLIVLYVFWELTSLASFLLIAYWYHREKSRYGAQKSMLITVSGGFAMLAGFVSLYLITDTFSIREIIAQAPDITGHALFLPAMLLILAGAFTKSAQFPFHIWLPDAMEAPTPVSAYLHSATMVKAGIYLVARMTPIFSGQAEWFWIISLFGIVTLFWGSFSAVKQTDLKSILAFSTVSQLGMIMCLLGLGSAAVHFGYEEGSFYSVAVVAAVFHLINHATFKGSLFMVVGIVDHETGTRDIRKLGGLMTLMPITFTLAVIGAFSMAGLPPFNGFLSKEMFFTGVLNASTLDIFNMETWTYLFPVLAWIASVFTFIYSMVLVFRTFTGQFQPEKLETKPHEAPLGMLIPPVILASLVLIIGFFPNLLSKSIIEPATASILPTLLGPENSYFKVDIYFWHGFNAELFMTMGVIGVGTLMFIGLHRWSGVYDLFPKRLALNHFYDQGLVQLERLSEKVTRIHMTGFIRDYLVYIFAFFILLLLGSLYTFNAFTYDFEHTADIGIFEVILSLVMVAGALGVVFARKRITAIISIGVVGYVLALFFVVFRAPDLALTQLVVETVSVALFLLCFYHLPVLKVEKNTVPFKLTNLIISVGVGLTVTLIALSANATRLFEPISEYFIEASYKEAGGKNMVNVILVDFRGFDTLLEILVLGIAALGVYTLVKLRLARRDEA